MSILYHISEEPGIERFEPRPPPSLDAGIRDDCVWAIDEAHLPNYLLPRDCPRVAFRIQTSTTESDRSFFIGPSAASHVIAIEAAWLERAQTTILWAYHLPPDSFTAADLGAGYYISRLAVTPMSAQRIENPLVHLLQRRVELRLVKSLWPLRHALLNSTLQFSCIRMRNAQPEKLEHREKAHIN